MPRYRHAAVGAAAYALLTTCQALAQRPAGPPPGAPPPDTNRIVAVSEEVRQQHMVHVWPNLIVFDPVTTSTPVTLSNIGDTPTEADVMVQFGFPYWQNTDTTLLPPPGKNERGHDTVIFNPGPRDRYAGAWLSGLPTHVTLRPHETRAMTLKITPPPGIPDGEYYARIVTVTGAHKKRAPVSQDTKETYMFPVKGWDVPALRDSARVFFRKGAQTMGVEILEARAEIDSTSAVEELGPRPLRILLRLHLTGTAHFEGRIAMSYVVKGGDEVPLTAAEGAAFALYRDGIMRWTAATDHLPPGEYHLVVRLLDDQDDFPAIQRLPMQTVEAEVPVRIPGPPGGRPLVTTGYSTGQGLPGGVQDPYWRFIPGAVDYNAPDALTNKGTPAWVTSRDNQGTWAPRSRDPESNVNNGWIGASDSRQTAAANGENTMRLFVDLTKADLRSIKFAGTAWGDLCVFHIHVNGRLLSHFIGEGSCPMGFMGSTRGREFSISQSDGLVQGMNVFDFSFYKQDASCDGVRIDFHMLFRETHDRPLMTAEQWKKVTEVVGEKKPGVGSSRRR